MSNISPIAVLTRDEFAKAQGVSSKTITRYLDARRIPGAEFRDGRWNIPANAQIQDTPAPTLATVPRQSRDMSRDSPEPVTLTELLNAQPAYLPVDIAARLLGVPESAIRRRPSRFGAVKFGPHGSLLVPQAAVRSIAGLR